MSLPCDLFVCSLSFYRRPLSARLLGPTGTNTALFGTMGDSDQSEQSNHSTGEAALDVATDLASQQEVVDRRGNDISPSPRDGNLSPFPDLASPSRMQYPPHFYPPYPTYGVQYPPPPEGSPANRDHPPYYSYPPPGSYPSTSGSAGRSGGNNSYGYNPSFIPSQHSRMPPSPPRVGENRNDHASQHPKVKSNAIEQLEAQRLEAAAAMDLALSMVKPIQTDFHFFVKDTKEALLAETKKEISRLGGDENDVYLVNTNLNSRLMKAWEDLPPNDKQKYVTKEEEDRKRFTEEEEVASRHCATLTARSSASKRKEEALSPSSMTKKTRA